MNWIGWMFASALITIAFEIYSDASISHCVPGSFFAIVRLCNAGTKQGRPTEAAITERGADQKLASPHGAASKSQSKVRHKQHKPEIE
jgi:hypothetical protein